MFFGAHRGLRARAGQRDDLRGGDSSGALPGYARMASACARQVIQTYSTSFDLATNLLAPKMRNDIRNLYAMVRIADEIVDGSATAAGLGRGDIDELLNDYERAVIAAPRCGFHTDPVLHAYGDTARRCDLQDEHIQAFFRSMRMDLTRTTHNRESLQQYIYGSAEVIGLMCLAIFLADVPPVPQQQRDVMENGAKALGAAFQKINFLRDYAEDSRELGRAYFPQSVDEGLTEEAKRTIVAEVRNDLARAEAAIELLPAGARPGVAAATALFCSLTDKINNATAEEVRQGRISIGNAHKAVIVARALAGSGWWRR